MSIAPPRGPEDERGSAETDAQPPLAEAAPAAGSGVSAPETDANPFRAQQIALYEAEAALAEVTDPKRSAWLLHQAAYLREQRGGPGSEREAARLYTQAMLRDPGLQPNSWALYRAFTARESWDNVLRLLDAEARFAPTAANPPQATDRADLLLEKGRILEDRLGRNEEAIAAYRGALAVAPAHAGALLALLLIGVSEGNGPAIEEALGGLVAHLDAPLLRALLVVELARRRRGSLTGEGVEQRVAAAADILFHALAGPAAEEPICAELDRLSLIAGAGGGDLRARVLDLFESRFARQQDSAVRDDPAMVVAVHREKARLLAARGARDAALAVLERGLKLMPRHPLLVADLLDQADEAGRPDAIAALEEGDHLPFGDARDEAQLRRAEAAARAGAHGEAMGILARLPEGSSYTPLATLVRVRVLARAGDIEGLATAFSDEAEQLETLATEQPDQPEVIREAAHLYVRAAVLRGERLREPVAAERLLRKALALLPGDGPAREALRATLAARGDLAGLTAFYEGEAAAATEPEARTALYRSAYLVARDLTRDEAASARLAEHAPPVDELTAMVNALDELGERVARAQDSATATRTELLPALRTLLDRLTPPVDAAPEERARTEGGLARLALLAARLSELAGDHLPSDDVNLDPGLRAFAVSAFAAEPGGGAAAVLERLHRRAGRPEAAARVLAEELRAVEASAPEVARALRFRLAVTAAQAGAFSEALAALSPLRAAGDRAAVVWSVEIARQGGGPALEAQLLDEPATRALLVSSSDDGETLLRLSRIELVRQLRASPNGEVGAAASGDGQSAQNDNGGGALDGGSPRLRAELALGGLRDAGAAVPAYSALADALAGTELGVELAQDAELLAAAAGVAPRAAPPGDAAAAGVVAFVEGSRRGDAGLAAAGLERLAMRAAGVAVPALFAQLGLRRLLVERDGAAGETVAAFTRALASPGAEPLVEVAVTELGGARASAGPLRGLAATRAERLAGRGPASAAVAAALLAESAARDEVDGRPGAAAAGYARLLALEPSSLEGVLGLGRLAAASNVRRAQATALVREGKLLADRALAAHRFAQAALLFAAEGLDDDAGTAWAEVLRRQPTDETAYRQLHKVLTARDDAAALERLITFRLGRVAEPAAKIELYAQRAALRLEALDRRDDAIADHRRVLALDPDNVISLRALGTLATEAGRPELAAQFLGRAVGRLEDPDQAHRLRLDLAAAHAANEDDRATLRVLREAAEARPRDRQVRELLVEAGMRAQQWELVASELERLRELAETPEDQSAWTVRLGRLERDQRRNREAALDAFRAALRLDPLGEAAREIGSTLGTLPLPPEDGPAVQAAVGALRAAIIRNPLSPRHLESLVLIARAGGLVDVAETAAQLHALLGGPPIKGRSRGLVRTLAPALIAPVAETTPLKRAIELWPLLAEPIARLRAGDGAQFAAAGASRATRLAPGREPRLAWAEAAATSLGLTGIAIYTAGGDDLAVSAFDAPECALVLGRGVAGGDATARFKVGRALALLAQKAALLDQMTPEELRLDWSAAILYLTEKLDPELDANALRARAKSLGKIMTRKERKAIEPLAAGLGPSALDLPGWRTHVLRAATRAGLLVSGDLGAALKVVTRQGNPSPADFESEDALDLIHFAFGERYTSLRQEVRERDRVNAADRGSTLGGA